MEGNHTAEAILDALPLPAAILDGQGMVSAVNRSWTLAARDEGPEARTGPGSAYGDLLQDSTAAERVAGVIGSPGESVTFERTFTTPRDPRWLCITATGLAAAAQGGPGALVTHREVTAERRAEAALQDTTERFQLTAQGSSDGLWEWGDPRLDRMWWSPRVYDLLGYEPNEFEAGVEWLMTLLHPDERKPLRRALLGHLYGQVPFDVEHRLRCKLGGYRWFRIRGQAQWDRDGVPLRMAGCIHDISQYKLTEEKLRFRHEFERLITSISTRFIHLSTNQIDQGIELALRDIADFMAVDRSQVWQCNAAGVARRTHGWTRDGVPPGPPPEATMTVEDHPYFLQTLQAGRLIYAPRVDRLEPAAVREREAWLRDGVRSLIALPLFSGDKIMGGLVFEAVREPRSWSEDDMALLKIVGEIIARALDRRDVEVALRHSREERERQATLMEQTQASAQVGGWELALDSNTLYWTNQTYRIHETTPDRYRPTASSALRFFTAESEPAMVEASRRAIEEGRPFDLELELVTALGNRIWVRVTGKLVRREGRPFKLYGAFQNITERKRGEEALRRSEYRLMQAQHIAKLGSWRLEQADGTLSWSTEMYRIFGVDSATFAPTVASVMEMVHPDDRDAWLEVMQSSLGNSEVADYHGRITRPDGDIRHLYGRSEVELDATGQPARLVGVIQDVTERKQLEEQLQQAQKMEGIGRLAGGIAHDFNNILTMIMGHTELAQSMTDIDDPRYEDIEAIRTAGKRAAKLTQQLLAFSRKQIIAPKVVNPNRMLLTIDAMLRRVIGEDIELVTIPAEDLGHIRVDPSQLEQVLMNLAVNARDAMPHGGQLRLETSNARLDADYVVDHPYVTPGDYIRVSVTDSGCGMDSQTLSRVFEPFFTTKEPGKGTGLGLATCYGIVKQSGGHITVDSTAGAGTTFRIYFPQVHAVAESGEVPEMVTAVPTGKETILVVEDEAVVRDLAARVLRSKGYTVLAAAHPSAALEISQRERNIDLLVTDVVMPQMGGKKLADRLCDMRPGLPVLYVSGYTEDNVVHHGVLDEDIFFLAKPFTPAALAFKVREVLDGPEPAPQAGDSVAA